ncbi:hypothetical protein [Flavobacterium silvaticum]|uniref:VWA domain-containing protein n=1 Tax=Flavobacterium silvaticum TaxID=1852020 RepID=A0A972JGE5_9FLAO|nr:hypothetical protein [Flavobacterium silvaticum]NMH28964.1 hypothetical protein [Flavobacterium silvaticum]
MTATTSVLIILSVLVAAGIAYYQYIFRSIQGKRLSYLLAGLRFIAIFGLLLLLINPRILKTWYEAEKTPLPVVIDNSASIIHLKADARAKQVFERITSDSRLKQKYDVQAYRFDSEMEASETPDFKGSQTSIEAVAKNLSAIYRNKKFPTVLISDGNQTRGNDYVYRFENGNPVFPVVLGDTVKQTDIRISQVNVNKYAFLKNKFPVEAFVQYSGTKPVETKFEIRNGQTVIASQNISFSADKKSAVLNLLLPAEKAGLQLYKATVNAVSGEKNTYNNTKNFAVEVMDQRSEIAIVSAINHPDIGALKRSIETNSQRRVTLLSPTDQQDWSKFNVLIVYQPTAAFGPLMDRLENSQSSCMIITGVRTDFNFLNTKQKLLAFRMSSQSENYLPVPNDQFSLFEPEELPFVEFPPLDNAFGTIKASGNVNELLGSSIRNVKTGSPLLGFAEEKGRRWGFLLGEGIWKWRLQSYVTLRSFEQFDRFMDKSIQYLSTNNSRKSLIVNHESFYNMGDPVEITAQYFNKNYEFDEKARINVTLTHRKTKKSRSFDMLKSGNSFKVNLDGLEAGAYDFKVRELNSNASYSGYFELLDFEIEKQFVNPDLEKLNQLASVTDGKTYLPDQADALIDFLLKDETYKTVEKAISRRVPLIDSIWLLLLIAASLAAEWFIRKYNGML